MAKKESPDTKKKAKKRQPKYHVVINSAKSKKAKWYVVHTYSGHETKVAEQLRQRVESMGLEGKIFELLIPTQEKIEIRQGLA